ncbi:MAG: hypothetical protein KKH95_00400, partial [Gammaproteobacteria bacterium]|nr:hypothetical protein [Gammaproteobacteria bacterium]
MLFAATAEPEISDQADNSFIRLTGEKNGDSDVPFSDENALYDVQLSAGNAAAELSLSAHLYDLSGNHASVGKTLNVLPYLQSGSHILLSLQAGTERFVDVKNSLSLGFVSALNQVYGGFLLQVENAEIYRSAEGTVRSIQADGDRVAVAYEISGANRVRLLEWRDNIPTVITDVALRGDLVGMNGDLLFAQAGNTILAWQLTGTTITDLPGVTPGEIISTVYDAGHLWVLTDNALVDIQPTVIDGLIGLYEAQRFNSERYQSFAVVNKRFALNAGQRIDFYQLTDEGLVSDGEYSVAEPVQALVPDDNIWWLQLNNGTWHAVRSTEQIGLLSEVQRLIIGRHRFAYFNGTELIVREKVIGDSVTPAFSVENAKTGYHISSDQPLTVVARDTSGQQRILHEIDRHNWLLPYHAAMSSIVVSYVGMSGSGEESLLLNEPVFTDQVLVSPAGQTLAEQGNVPLLVTPDSEPVVISNTGDTEVAPLAGLGWQWWQPMSSSLSHTFNASGTAKTYDWIGTANQSEGRIDILSPENNAAYRETDWLRVRFDCVGIPAVRYSRVILEDFNGQAISAVYVGGCDGDVNLQLPALDLAENYYVKVQAYYGDELYFTQSKVALKAVPLVKSISAALSVPQFQLAGSALELERGNTESINTGLILVEDLQGNILASAENFLRVDIPDDAQEVVVRSYVDDGKGNSDTAVYRVVILAPFKLQPQADVASFSDGVARVGETLFARGRTVQNEAGEMLLETSQNIIAVEALGRRLVVLTKEGISIFDGDLNYQQVAHHPLVGL